MKFRQIGLCMGMLLLTTMAYGNLKSSNVNLTGGTIKPHETLKISTSKLMSGVTYKVTCKINDPNNEKNKVYLKVSSGDSMTWSPIYLNGNFVYSPQLALNQVDSILEIGQISNTTQISITNLDDSDSVTVTAAATPEVY